MNIKLKSVGYCLASLLALAGVANAQITIVNQANGLINASAPVVDGYESATFDGSAGNAVVLLVGADFSGAITNVTFAGQPMTLGGYATQSPNQACVFYLVNPAVKSGTFVFQASSTATSEGFFASALALAGVQGAADANSANGTGSTFSLVTTNGLDNGFVVVAADDNGNVAGRAPKYVSGICSNLMLSAIHGYSACAHYYGYAPTAGTYTNTYNQGYQRTALAAVSFDPVITPSLVWAVGSGAWDINTTANWTNPVAGGGYVTYQETLGVGDFVTFDDTSSGTSPITVTLDSAVSPSSVTNNSSKDYIITGSGSISGGTVTKAGSGTLTLDTANTFGGGINLNGGTTVFSTINNLGSGSITFDGGTLKYNGNADDISARTVTFNAGGATIDDGGNSIYFSNPVGNNGAGGFTKMGAGTLTFGTGYDVQSFNYHGNTVVAAGTLFVNAYASVPNTPAIIVNAGATFDDSYNAPFSLNGKVVAGAGVINGSATIGSGVITPGTNGVAGTLTFANDLSIAGGSLVMDVSTDAAQNDLLVVGGTLTVTGGALQLNVSGTLTNGTYKLIQYGSLSGAAGAFTLTGYSQPGKSLALDDSTPGEIDLVVADTANDNLVWTGTAGATWDSADSLNWLNGATPWAYTNGDAVVFDQTGIANPNVSLQTAVSPGSVVVNNDAGTTYDFQDGTGLGGGKIRGAAALVKQGAGTLTVETINQNTGGTTIEAGAVNVSGSLGSGAVTNNGDLVLAQTANDAFASLSGAGSVTRNGASGTVTVSGVADYTGPTTISTGTLAIGSGGAAGALSTSAITNNGALILNSSTDWAYAMSDTGTGSLEKAGTNTLTMNGINTRTGNTRVDGGKVILGNANQLKGPADVESGATLDMNGLDQYVGGLNSTAGAGGRIVNDAGTATNVLTVDQEDAVNAADSSVVIADNDGTGGIVSVVKTGPGKQHFRGASSYSGGTIISNGTAVIRSSAAFGTGPVVFRGGNVSVYSSPTIPYAFSADADASILTERTGNATFSGSFTTSHNLTFNMGAETWSFSNDTNLYGVTGAINIQGTTSSFFRFTSSSGSPNATFDFTGSSAQLSSSGTGTFYLGALVGDTLDATLRASGASTWIVGDKNVDTTFGGTLGTAGNANNFIKTGTGRLTLSGQMNFTGTTTVSNGVLALVEPVSCDSNAAVVLASSASVIDVSGRADGTLNIGAAAAQTLAGIGTVNGNLTAAGANGTVSPGISGAGTLTVANNATFNDGSILSCDLSTVNTTGAGTNDLLQVGGGLSLAGGAGTVYVRANFAGTNLPAFGQPYTIITYSGALTGGAANLALISNKRVTGTFDTTSTPGAVTVTFAAGTPGDIVWQGAASGAWEASLVTNWLSGVTPTNYFDADNVTFDDTASNFTVAVNGALYPGSVLVNNNATNYVFSGGSLSGGMALTKQGTGSLTLNLANTYSGGTTNAGGVVIAGNTTAFGTGPVFMTGGAIQLLSGASSLANNTYLLAPTNAIYPNGGGNPNYWPAPLIGTNALLVDFSTNGSTFTLNGGAAKWAGVTNTTYLRGSGGSFRISSGCVAPGVTLDLSDSAVRIGSAAGPNTWQLGGLVGNASTATIGDSDGSTVNVGYKNQTNTFAGNLIGNFNWIKVGTGALTLTGTNTTTGSLTVSNGTLALAQNAAPSGMGTITVISNATLDVSGLAGSALTLGATNVVQTLRGGGTVNGSVVIGTNGIVRPGITIGTLTVNNALTLDGAALMELNRTNSQTADLISAASFSGTGAVNVTNIGPDLVAGDTFQLFSAVVPGVTINLPVSNALNTVEYVWTNRVDQDGSIELLSAVSSINTNPPVMGAVYSGGVLSLSWPTNAGWTLQMQTNSLSTGLGTNWVNVPGSTSITSTNITVDPSKPTVFYRLALPTP